MKMRTRWIVVVTAALLLTTLILLPRISEAGRSRLQAKRAGSKPVQQPSIQTQDQKADITVVASYHNDTSIPLRDMKPQPALQKAEHANKNRKIPVNHKDSPDPVVQDSFSDLKSLMTVNMPSPLLNFNGIGFPGRGLQLRAARHQWRSGRDAVCANGQRRLPGL